MIGDVNVKLSKPAAERIDKLIDTFDRIGAVLQAIATALEESNNRARLRTGIE